MKTDGTLNTTDKIMKNQKETQEMMVKVMESMYKTEQSHQTTLETMLKIAETLKKLNLKFQSLNSLLIMKGRKTKESIQMNILCRI